MNHTKLADLLYPNVTRTPDDMRTLYPPRNLPEGAMVTRHSPSPTGFVHLGNLYQSLICERLAHQSRGVFFLRIEDTDQKRKVEGATEAIIDGLAYYGVNFDEGDNFGGSYGPYTQSERVDIYHVYAKWLVQQGLAYTCFCSEDTLEAIRNEQMANKEPDIGYHGKWTNCRDLSLDQVGENLATKTPWVLRFRVTDYSATSFKHTDLVKGDVNITPNKIDHVLLKSDGIPTYHMARSIDDQLMGVTHTIRGDEWLATFPFHLQLDRALGFRTQKFMHFGALQKMDCDSKRKLSKRHDPELALSYYREVGYPVQSVREYMMTILNSNYEDWRRANPPAALEEFPFSAKKITPAGCLFDLAKLMDVSKNVVAAMSAEAVYAEYIEWAREFDAEMCALMEADPDYARRIFAIGRGGAKPRKDIGVWTDVRPYVALFYDELFTREAELPPQFAPELAQSVLARYLKVMDLTLAQEDWFEQLKSVAVQFGFAPDPKTYKAEPEAYPGHVGDVAALLRIAVTGRTNSPDLREVMVLLGEDKVRARIANK